MFSCYLTFVIDHNSVVEYLEKLRTEQLKSENYDCSGEMCASGGTIM